MGYGSGLGWMWLFWLLLFVGLGLLIVLGVRALGGGVTRETPSRDTPPRGSSQPVRSRAREILDERYASGELSIEEYREWIRVLDEPA